LTITRRRFLDVIRSLPTRSQHRREFRLRVRITTTRGIITMTTTGESTRRLPLIGQAVGQAQASRTRFLTGILEVTGPILAAIDPGDLETTVRTLEEITRLARETTTTEGNR
jgi:hypothetical protein